MGGLDEITVPGIAVEAYPEEVCQGFNLVGVFTAAVACFRCCRCEGDGSETDFIPVYRSKAVYGPCPDIIGCVDLQTCKQIGD